MSTDTKIKTLIFNKLTQEQYNNADRVPTEFYLTPDDTDEKLAAKQDKLIAGTNITIVDNVISATGGSGPSVDLTGYYNKENLLGADEIEIVEEPVEDGIDSHTKGCWHFDGNNENAVDGSVMTSSTTSFDTNGKFGSCAKKPTFTGWMPTSSDDYTWDFWFKTSTITGYDNGQVGGIGNYSGGYKYGCFYKQDAKLYAVRSGESVVEQPFATLQENVWTHLALTRQNNIERWFVNGELIRQGENTYNATSKEAFKSATNADFDRIDEYRISDIARYTEDFEPPTKPYSVAVPTGNYVVRNKTKLVHKSDIGVANGVASLDTNGKVPTEQIPVATTSALGVVKPDGTTITVTEDGTLNANTDTLATKTELTVALNDRADKQLSNTNLITNCILSAPNGVLQAPVDLSEQIKTSEATISNNVMTAGIATFSVDSTRHGVDKSKVWKVKTTFTITTAETNTNLTAFYRTSQFDNFPDDYYLEIFGVRYQNSTLTFEFLRGINNVVSFSTRAQRSTTIEAGKKYTATYRSDGFISLYQGDTKILEETRSSYSFATVFPTVVESKAYGDVYWRSDSATIDFRNSNFTYNDGGKVVPVVGDPYTLTVNKGLKVALATGYNTDGTPKSEIVTLENDTTVTVPSSSNYNYPIDVILIKPVSGGSPRIVVPRNTDFCVLDSNLENIAEGQYKVWYNKNTNLYYEHLNGVTTAYGGVLLGSGKFVSSKFTDIVSYKPIQLSLEGFGDYVVEYQVNADSSWYRKYKSGWLEQGGIARIVSAGAVIPLAKPFADTIYTLIVSPNEAIDGYWPIAFGYNKTTTSFSVNGTGKALDAQSVIEFSWEAKGMGAN